MKSTFWSNDCSKDNFGLFCYLALLPKIYSGEVKGLPRCPSVRALNVPFSGTYTSSHYFLPLESFCSAFHPCLSNTTAFHSTWLLLLTRFLCSLSAFITHLNPCPLHLFFFFWCLRCPNRLQYKSLDLIPVFFFVW